MSTKHKLHRDSAERSPRKHHAGSYSALDFYGKFGWRKDLAFMLKCARLVRRDARLAQKPKSTALALTGTVEIPT